ncbi:dienelactone hydrolase family protein [Aspergillus clavatus NRRL 1]|uniref:Dienelactone hydrolase family protein n=1 Tax=Aspergillus clavatus (strain ATCC 1007 / CBS 513.65 / DSM 816 / NCTC 3887 / NRRL 1 / QM 1276 / 107) TaxID=344612 RepID=A1C9G4_ASPCL|nr:dienelactone hydrolase family protein [Aspergillus clavatus NRRL 1]EAW13488.1 dienelactone hydrolase family protein [Aspergillus clavatus NRRL 1]
MVPPPRFTPLTHVNLSRAAAPRPTATTATATKRSGSPASPSSAIFRQQCCSTSSRALATLSPHNRPSLPQTFSSGPGSQHFHSSIAMSTSMPATHGHSEACCNIPPVVADGYIPKGSYEQHGGLKTYVTGPADATKGIISIFDIFGYFNQTLQGADILATGDAQRQYKLFMPDWFKRNPCPIEWYPPDTEEKQKNLRNWFGQHAPNSVADALPEYVRAVQAANPSIQSWGLIGFCWGGKVTELITSNPSINPFRIAATAHPAMIDPAGAAQIAVPYILLASSEERAETVQAFEQGLQVPHHVETFGDQVHGWMAARADLRDPRVREEYLRGYRTVLKFFEEHWD